MVTISRLILGVNSALGSCPATPTATPSATVEPPTATATPATATATTAATPTATPTGSSTATPTLSPTAGAGVCGDGVLDPGETCDDGNTIDDDSCPADCAIAPCAGPPQGTLTVEVHFATTPSDLRVGGLTLFLRYPEDRVSIPGANGDAAVQARVTSPAGFSVAADDLNYALRAVLDDPGSTGIGAGTALSVQFDICAGAAVPVFRNFACAVEAASGVDAEGMPTDASGQVSCSIVVKPAVLPLVCGDGIVNLAGGETCDDGNTDDGDGCPSNCRIEPCQGPPQGRLTVQVGIATMPSNLTVAGMTMQLDYPEGRVTLPGSNNDPTVQDRVTSPAGFGVTANDLDYALRAVLIDPTLNGIGAGTALSVDFDICAGAAVPVAKNFTCSVVDAAAVDEQGMPIDVSDQVTCSIVVRPAELPLVCGDGIVNLAGGETCDDGNTEDGDGCPSNCRVEPCDGPSQGHLTIQAQLATMPSDLTVAGITLQLDYPEGRVTLPGSNNDPTVQDRVTSPIGFGVTPNDLDYALRAVLIDPTLNGIGAGTALSVDFDICAGAAVPVAKNFTCRVIDAAAVDEQGMPVDVSGQVTCAITVQPPVLPLVCGDGIVNLAGGETCDDGNTEDGDGCPSTCRVEPCALPGSQSVTATVQFSTTPPDLSLSGMTLFIDYPDGSVGIQGAGNDAAVQSRVASPSFAVTPNDFDYGLRTVLIDPTFSGVTAGTALTVQFDVCQGGELPPASAFSCQVLDAADVELAPVTDQVTCTVTLP
jgi:cysteine-rich repeat protein